MSHISMIRYPYPKFIMLKTWGQNLKVLKNTTFQAVVLVIVSSNQDKGKVFILGTKTW